MNKCGYCKTDILEPNIICTDCQLKVISMNNDIIFHIVTISGALTGLNRSLSEMSAKTMEPLRAAIEEGKRKEDIRKLMENPV